MSFAFEFSGGDINNDSDEEMGDLPPSESASTSNELNVPTYEDQYQNGKKARRANMTELVGCDVLFVENVHGLKCTEKLSSLPSQISYTASLIISPKGRKALILRRALFDVKIQMIAESDDDEDGDEDEDYAGTTLRTNGPQGMVSAEIGNSSRANRSFKRRDVGLGDSDIEKDVYEGGFKSWEGAMDLAKLLLDRGAGNDTDKSSECEYILELGCGTAIPTLVLFQHALSADLALNFTLADYNESVLRLVTIPNLLLIWALQHSPESFSPQPSSPAIYSTEPAINDAEGDLEISPALIEAFISDLVRRQISITLVSGPWSASQYFLSLIPVSPKTNLLILAAETIYSLKTLRSFTSALLAILKLVEQGKAIVAAKRMYFGVGGGVDEFKARVVEAGGVVTDVEGSRIPGCDRGLIEETGGVGRWLGEVRLF